MVYTGKTRLAPKFSGATTQRFSLLQIYVIMLCLQHSKFAVQIEIRAQSRAVFIAVGVDGTKSITLLSAWPHLALKIEMARQTDAAYY